MRKVSPQTPPWHSCSPKLGKDPEVCNGPVTRYTLQLSLLYVNEMTFLSKSKVVVLSLLEITVLCNMAIQGQCSFM